MKQSLFVLFVGEIEVSQAEHRALISATSVALVWSLIGFARGDLVLALLPWLLPAAAVAWLAWKARRKE